MRDAFLRVLFIKMNFICDKRLEKQVDLFVISSGIEPESRASEALILSIVLRDRLLLRESK